MLRIKCPICGGLLTINEKTRKVMSHVTAEEAARTADEHFDLIVSDLQKAKQEQESRLEAAKKRETDRKERLDDLFQKAQDKTKESPDADKPMGPVWD